MHSFIVTVERADDEPREFAGLRLRHLIVRATVTAPSMEAAKAIGPALCYTAGRWLVTVRDPASGTRGSFEHCVPETKAA